MRRTPGESRWGQAQARIGPHERAVTSHQIQPGGVETDRRDQGRPHLIGCGGQEDHKLPGARGEPRLPAPPRAFGNLATLGRRDRRLDRRPPSPQVPGQEGGQDLPDGPAALAIRASEPDHLGANGRIPPQQPRPQVVDVHPRPARPATRRPVAVRVPKKPLVGLEIPDLLGDERAPLLAGHVRPVQACLGGGRKRPIFGHEHLLLLLNRDALLSSAFLQPPGPPLVAATTAREDLQATISARPGGPARRRPRPPGRGLWILPDPWKTLQRLPPVLGRRLQRRPQPPQTLQLDLSTEESWTKRSNPRQPDPGHP